MERFKCKLCLKIFANGRALGGHMRSHIPNPSSKREVYEDIYDDDEDDDDEEEEDEEEEERPSQLSEETESGSLLPSSSSYSDDEGNAVDLCYRSRENPIKKSIPVATDPDREFGFGHHGSVVVVVPQPQDGESETESHSRINSTWRRSKRTRKLVGGLDLGGDVKKLKPSKLGCGIETGTEPEPLSSVSDATTDEDLAVCLMMLSRDKWKTKNNTRVLKEDGHDNDHGYEENDTDESEGYRLSKNKTRSKYKCDTCDKVFKSYQALGGHRASHKKNRTFRATEHQQQRQITEHENHNGVAAEKKIHECPICFRVFPSGQALGGHKRSHGVGGVSENHFVRIDKEVSVKQRLIDLNLPAPTDDNDETSQVEVSSVVFDE